METFAKFASCTRGDSTNAQMALQELPSRRLRLPEKAPEVYRTVGVRYDETIIGPAEQETLKAHTARYNASDILHQRPKLKSEIQADLGTWLMRYGIQPAETSISNISFDAGYAKAIEGSPMPPVKRRRVKPTR